MDDAMSYVASSSKGEQMQDPSQWWWSEGIWNDTIILCHQERPHKVYKTFQENLSHYGESHSSLLLCNLAVILAVTTFTWFLLRHLHIPITSQMIGGVVVMGILFSNPDREYGYHALLPPTVIFIMKTMSFVGFIFHLFMLGVETNMSFIIKRVEKKSFVISLTGSLASLALGFFALFAFGISEAEKHENHNPNGTYSLITLNAQSFFLVTCNNINDLGIGNSDIARLASSIALILDLLIMVSNFILIVIVDPIFLKAKGLRKPITLLSYYAIVFFIFRPIVLYILKHTPEGRAMKKNHFIYIFLIVLMVAGLGEVIDEMFAVFLFALSLPEYPLSMVFSRKLDAMTSAVFFPLYCAMQGFQTNVYSLTKRSLQIELILILGYIGKFFGTTFSTYYFGVPLRNCMALALLVCAKGLLDIVSLGIWRDQQLVDKEQYTLAVFHFLILTGASMPLVRHLYEPLSQYKTTLRRSVSESTSNGTFTTLACLYKEDNLPGTIRLIEAFNPTRTRPIPVIVLQLMQLPGHCTIPILAPLHHVKPLANFRTKLASSNRIVEAFSNLERKTMGHTRLKHYIGISSYESMHNDACTLAFEKEVSLIILSFHTHVQWTKVGKIFEDSSQSVRCVNKMVTEKAPCTVGILLDRGNPHLGLGDNNSYQVAILFLGGPDDEEALSFTRLFGSHPNVKVVVVWLKSSSKNDVDKDEESNYEMIMSFKATNKATMKIREVVVNDCSDTTNVLLGMNGVVDLVVVGRHHDPKCVALHGLSLDGWREYPELGILGDLLATPDFGFSVLVVQKEPKDDSTMLGDSNTIV